MDQDFRFLRMQWDSTQTESVAVPDELRAAPEPEPEPEVAPSPAAEPVVAETPPPPPTVAETIVEIDQPDVTASPHIAISVEAEPEPSRASAMPVMTINTPRRSPRLPEMAAAHIRTTSQNQRRLSLLAGAATAFCIALAAFAAMPVGADASAVLVGAPVSQEAMRTEIAILRSADMAAAVVAKIGPAALLRCDLLETPASLFQPACLNFSGNTQDARARAVVNEAVSVTQDDANSALQIHVRHTSSAVATGMLATVLQHESDERRRMIGSLPSADDDGRLAVARKALADTEREISQLAVTSNSVNPTQTLAASAAEAVGLTERENELTLQLQATQAELDKALELLRTTPPRVIETQETTQHDAAGAAQQTLLQLRLERAHLQSAYAPAYPALTEVEHKIKIAEEDLRTRQASTQTMAHQQPNPVYSALTLSVASLMPKAEGLNSQLHDVRKLRTSMAQRADTLGDVVTQLGALQQRREQQYAVVHELATSAAQVRAQAATTSVGLNGIRWFQQAPSSPMPGTMRLTVAGLSGMLGFWGGFMVPKIGSRRRKSYHSAREAQRHLDLPRLADIGLDDLADSGLLPRQEIVRLFRWLDQRQDGVQGMVYVIGTDRQDGATQAARILAQGIAATFGLGVLLSKVGDGGQEWVESFAPWNAHIDVERCHTGRALPVGDRVMPQLISQQAFTGELIESGDAAGDEALPADTGPALMMVVATHSEDSGYDQDLAARSDMTVLVLRAGHSDKAVAGRLRDDLVSHALRPAGFVFTHGHNP